MLGPHCELLSTVQGGLPPTTVDHYYLISNADYDLTLGEVAPLKTRRESDYSYYGASKYVEEAGRFKGTDEFTRLHPHCW